MKKLIAVMTAVLMLAVVPASLADGDLLESIQARGTITIAMEGDWRPWTYHDENDELAGFEVEMGNLIAEGLGVKAEFQEVPWESVLAGVDSGRFDIACNGVSYTAERAKSYTFSEPYLYTDAVLVVGADNGDIHELEDLKGRNTSNSPNSTYAEMAEEAGATVIYVDTLGETMMMLEQGRVDATINAKASVEDYLKEHPDAKIKIVKVIKGDQMVIPARKGPESEALVAKINEILAAAKEDGRLADLSVKYFGADMTQPIEE